MLKILIFFLLGFISVASEAQTWINLGPCGSETYGNRVASQGGTGQIHSIVFDPDNQKIVYSCAPFGGLWRSEDSGKSWSNKDIDVDQNLEFSSVNDIAITQNRGVKTLWITTGHPSGRGEILHTFEPFSSGLYMSVNGGRNFKPVTSFNKKYGFQFLNKKRISRIVAHPSNPSIIYVASSDGLYQTTDGGNSWKLVLIGKDLSQSGITPNQPESMGDKTSEEEHDGSGIFSVAFSKLDPDHIIYASGTDIYRSEKAGKKGSFKSMTHDREDLFGNSKYCLKTLTMNIELNVDSGKEVMYVAAFIKGDTCGVYKHKTDYNLFYYNGEQWAKKNAPPYPTPDGIRLKMASVPGQCNLIYAGSATVSLSKDYGATWKQVVDYNRPGHADIHAIKNIPGTPDILTGTDGGIFRYSYGTQKVDEYNDGLCLGQVIDMGTSARNPNRIIIGLQDVGSDIWDGKDWVKLPASGDGYYGQLIDYSNNWNFFSCHNSQFYHNTSDTGFRLTNCTVCGQGSPYSFAQDPVHPSIFYYGARDLYKSVDNAKTWCRVSDFSKKGVYLNASGQVLYDIEFAPANPNIIFTCFNATVGGANTYLFKTLSGGNTCEGNCGNPSGPDAWSLIKTPAIETGDGQKNFQVNSTHSISTIAVSDKSPDKFWLGYNYAHPEDPSFRIFKTENNGETWTADNDGFPEFPVTKLLYVNASDDELFAGTWNGVYHKKGTSGWEKFGNELPHIFVSDMEINYPAHKLRVSTFGRGVWEIELP